MRTTYLAALIAAVAQARPHLEVLQSYTFEEFVAVYQLDLQPDTQEYALRRQNFEMELARVVAHNNSGKSWTENINHMSAMTPQEKKIFFGRSKIQPQGHLATQHHREANFTNLPEADLPTSVDWRSAGIMTAVKDQGGCGSCWANASTAAIESHAAIASGQLFDLSIQQMAACAPNPDDCGGFGNC